MCEVQRFVIIANWRGGVWRSNWIRRVDGEATSAEARNLPNHEVIFRAGDVQGANADWNNASAGIPFAMSGSLIGWALAGACVSNGATMAKRKSVALAVRQIVSPKRRPKNAPKRAITGVAVVLRP